MNTSRLASEEKISQVENVIIYTDGACSGNPGIGGWGAVLIFLNNEIKEISGGNPYTTNNKMEMQAIIESLKHVKKNYRIKLYTDSLYVKNGITDWIKKWKVNGWKTANKEPVKNLELWLEMSKLAEEREIEWHWVKGHSGHKHNDRADFLARAEIKKIAEN